MKAGEASSRSSASPFFSSVPAKSEASHSSLSRFSTRSVECSLPFSSLELPFSLFRLPRHRRRRPRHLRRVHLLLLLLRWSQNNSGGSSSSSHGHDIDRFASPAERAERVAALAAGGVLPLRRAGDSDFVGNHNDASGLRTDLRERGFPVREGEKRGKSQRKEKKHWLEATTTTPHFSTSSTFHKNPNSLRFRFDDRYPLEPPEVRTWSNENGNLERGSDERNPLLTNNPPLFVSLVLLKTSSIQPTTPNKTGRLPPPRPRPPAHLLQRPHLPLRPVVGTRRRLLPGADRRLARSLDPFDARVVHDQGEAPRGQGVLLEGRGPKPEGDEVGVPRRQGLGF